MQNIYGKDTERQAPCLSHEPRAKVHPVTSGTGTLKMQFPKQESGQDN